MSDVSITAANVSLVSGSVATGTAGASITAGQSIYINGSNQVVLAEANGTVAQAAATGVALNSAASGQPVTYAVNGATVNIGGTVAVGTIYVVSAANAGGIAPWADLTTTEYVTVLGVASTTGKIVLNINATGVQHA